MGETGEHGLATAAAAATALSKRPGQEVVGVDAGGAMSPAALVTATQWPDGEELLLVVALDGELLHEIGEGFARWEPDHLQIPRHPAVRVSRKDGRIALCVGGREIGSAIASDTAWRTAPDCLIGVAGFTAYSGDDAAAAFVAAFEAGAAAIAQADIDEDPAETRWFTFV